MKTIIHPNNKIKVTEIISDTVILNEVQDALEIMANSGSGKIILHEKNINPEFFDLSTGLAGEVLQKFTNYNVKLAIIGDFEKYESKSLKAFIFESNKSSHINFLSSVSEALSK